jgi:hypothetical protein
MFGDHLNYIFLKGPASCLPSPCNGLIPERVLGEMTLIGSRVAQLLPHLDFSQYVISFIMVNIHYQS